MTFKASTLVTVLVIGLGAGACSAQLESSALAKLNGRVSLPGWAKEVPSNPTKPWLPFGRAIRGTEGMQQAVGLGLYLTRTKAGTPNHPWWTLRLSECLADLGQDDAAFQLAGQIIALPANAPHRPKLGGFTSLDAVKRRARWHRVRIMARNGIGKKTAAEIQSLSPRTGYEKLLAAEALAIIGADTEAKRLLGEAIGDASGHPDRKCGGTLIAMRATVIARSLGDAGLVTQAGGGIVSKGLGSEKSGQWKGGLSVTKKAIELAGAGAANFARLKSGTYSGACRGFDGPIRVSVTVSGGKLRSARVTQQQESRPYSAFDAIPRRMVKRQSLRVDAVTRATVTSCAVINAIDEALTKASK